jgi:uncharacterized Zn-finger protein
MTHNQAAAATAHETDHGAGGKTTLVATAEVACDGGVGADGHPRVFLKLNPHTHQVVCPYCSHTFKLDPDAKVSAAH